MFGNKKPFNVKWDNKLKPSAIPMAQPKTPNSIPTVDPLAAFDQSNTPKQFFNLEKGENFGYDEQGNWHGSDSELAEKQREMYKKYLEEQGWDKFMGNGEI